MPAETPPGYWATKVRRVLIGALLLELAAALALVLPAGPLHNAAVPLAVLGVVLLAVWLLVLGLAWFGSRQPDG